MVEFIVGSSAERGVQNAPMRAFDLQKRFCSCKPFLEQRLEANRAVPTDQVISTAKNRVHFF
jgi:hypothetical protein